MSRRQEASDEEEDYHSNEEGEFSDSEAGSLENEGKGKALQEL